MTYSFFICLTVLSAIPDVFCAHRTRPTHHSPATMHEIAHDESGAHRALSPSANLGLPIGLIEQLKAIESEIHALLKQVISISATHDDWSRKKSELKLHSVETRFVTLEGQLLEAEARYRCILDTLNNRAPMND